MEAHKGLVSFTDCVNRFFMNLQNTRSTKLYVCVQIHKNIVEMLKDEY